MPDTSSKNKLLFDFYQNVKNDNEIFTIEDLKVAIKTLELAKEELKNREQKRIREAELEELKNKNENSVLNGKVLYLPKNLRRLKDNAFRGNEEIVKVVINEGCTEIGEYAFEGCINLKEIIFPKNKIMLRRGCFENCISLKEVNISEISNICPGAFENCMRLEKVFLPATISNIYTGVFKNCRRLHTVKFEKYNANCVSIYSKVFENCFSLETLDLPEICSVDTKAFLNCNKLKMVYIHNKWHYVRNFEKCDAKIIKI